MKRIIYLMIMLLCSISCQERYQTTIVLGVDNVRINLAASDVKGFTYPVYSSTDWTIEVTAGADWLSTETKSGNGQGYPRFATLANESELARVGVITVRGGGKECVTYIVQSGTLETYSDITDEQLENRTI